jgi:hypothetical protein
MLLKNKMGEREKAFQYYERVKRLTTTRKVEMKKTRKREKKEY